MLIHLPSVDCCYLPNLRQQWGKEKREKRRKWWWNTIKTRTTQSAFNNNNNSLLWITTDRYVSVQRCGLSCYCYYDFSFNSQVHAGALSISTWSRVKKIKQQSCERVFFPIALDWLVLKNYIASHAKPLLKRADCCRPGCDMPKHKKR
jgi:hypothetical protein